LGRGILLLLHLNICSRGSLLLVGCLLLLDRVESDWRLLSTLIMRSIVQIRQFLRRRLSLFSR